MNNKTIVNLSQVKLTQTQCEVLDYGLQFIPTPRTGVLPSVQEAIRKFARQVKLRYFFHGCRSAHITNKFVEKSNWTPPCHDDFIAMKLDVLDTLVTFCLNDRIDKSNLTDHQLNAIKSLRKNPEIIIKPADKGSATVVMSRESYIREAERQLGNEKHYTRLEEPVYPAAARKISRNLKRLVGSGYITEKQRSYLNPPDEPRHRQLYLLPKTHKAADKWPQAGKMPPGRPIISDCGSESYKVAEYIDSFLAPLAISHDSYVKNTTDFLDKVSKIVSPANAMLFTTDVESLYTNIDNTAGLTAVKQAFSHVKNPDRPDIEILELLDISLKKQRFSF